MAKKQKTSLSLADITAHPVLKDLFCYCLYKSAMRIRGLLDDELQAFGLIAPQSGILNLLQHYGQISQIQLGKELNIDKATMVMLIDGLEDLKLVKRLADPNDRRVKFIEITKLGLKTLEKVREKRTAVEDKFLEPLSAEERKILRQAIPKLLR